MLKASLLFLIFLVSSVAWAADSSVSSSPVPEDDLASLKEQTSTLTIPKGTVVYSNGHLQPGWKSWSWDLKDGNLNTRVVKNPATGSSFSLCTPKILPFGALSLHSDKPFPLQGSLYFWIRSNNGKNGGDISTLGLQFEGRNGDGYMMTASISIGELLVRMEDTNGGRDINMDGNSIDEGSRPATGAASPSSSSSEKLKRLALGDWVLVKVDLDMFKPSLAKDSDKYHAIMIGRCLQQDECEEDGDGPAICLDHITLVQDQ